MFSVATTVLETGAYYQAVFKSKASGMLKVLSGFEYKTTAKLSEKKHVIEVSKLEVFGRKVSKKKKNPKKSQLECVKCGQLELIPIGFKSWQASGPLQEIWKRVLLENCRTM